MKQEYEVHLRNAAKWAGIELDTGQIETLDRYRRWLETEAIPGGLIGPNEQPRLVRRHLADSILFAVGLHTSNGPILDVGSGAGLPGIPLAIGMPGSEFVLLERRAKRADLLQRASRVLDLENVEVIQGDLAGWTTQVPVIVSRATVPPSQVRTSLLPLLEPDGVVVLGGSWTAKPETDDFEIIEVPAEVLDQTVWLLIMRPK